LTSGVANLFLEPCHDLPRAVAAGRKETTMMPTSKKIFLATAAALILAWGVPGLRPAVAQDERSTGAEKPAATDAAPGNQADQAAPEPRPAQVAAPARALAPVAQRPVMPQPDTTPTAPPRNLKKVGDHWTPYNPPDPESFPAGATLHIISPGETLWGLADLTYNNPWLWPQLWNENRYITDSHWIYPGDPLLVPPRPVVVTQAGPEARPGVAPEILPQGQEGAPATDLKPIQAPEEPTPLAGPLAAEAPAARQETPATPEAPANGPESARYAKVDRDEVRCSGYINETGDRPKLFIAENEEPRFQGITTGSLIYISKGQKDPQVVPGATFSVVEREGTVLHPRTNKSLGHFYQRNGEVKILKVLPDTALATVTFACDEIRVGDELAPAEYQAVPARPIPALDRLRVERNGKPLGYVVHTRDTSVAVAAGDMVQIDLGQEDGLAPGDFLTAFDAVVSNHKGMMPAFDYQFGNEIFASSSQRYDEGTKEYPSLPVATMVVVTTEGHSATAKIVYSVREVPVGMMVEVN
jgi:nucleoid-associated protein YgaU